MLVCVCLTYTIKAVQKQDGDLSDSKQSGNESLQVCDHVGSSESCWAVVCWKEVKRAELRELKLSPDVHLTSGLSVKEAQSSVETTSEAWRPAAEPGR